MSLSRFARAFITALFASGLVLGMGSAAEAESHYPGENPNRYSTCPSTKGYMWKDYDYESWDSQNWRIQFKTSYKDLGTAMYRSGRTTSGAKTGSSFANNGTSGKKVCFYKDKNFKGKSFCFGKGKTSPGYSDWRDDFARSVRFQA
jgi:hypothetical protein